MKQRKNLNRLSLNKTERGYLRKLMESRKIILVRELVNVHESLFINDLYNKLEDPEETSIINHNVDTDHTKSGKDCNCSTCDIVHSRNRSTII